MLEIINNQRKVKIDAKAFEEFAGKVVEKISQTSGRFLTIAFVSDKKM